LHFETIDVRAPWSHHGAGSERLPILFHHGIGASAAIWAGWWPALVDAYRVVTFDMRGYGRSHVPSAEARWSLDLLIDDVFAVADAAGLRRFHLVGESIGGTVALAAAARRPERIATLTVSNGAHLGASIQGVKAWREQLAAGPRTWSDKFLQDRFHPGALSPERWAWFAEQQEKWPAHSVLNALGVLVGTDLTAELAGIRCPVLLLHPDGSPFIPVPVMAELHRLLPHSRLNVLAHSRHGLPFSHDRECAAALRAFLDSHSNDPDHA